MGTQVKSLEIKEFEELDTNIQDVYLRGVMDALIFSQVAYKQTRNSDDLFCVPKKVYFSTDLARAAMITSSDKFEQSSSLVVLSIIFGLMDMFPCE